MIASSLRYEKWCEHLSKTFGFVDRFYKLERTARLIDAKTENFISDLKDVKLLLLNGEKDRRVSLPEEKIGVEELRKVHNGQEGHDWKYMILPVRIHNVEKPYMIEAMKWTKKWMILIDEIMQSKI
jgi:hypothetical protein